MYSKLKCTIHDCTCQHGKPKSHPCEALWLCRSQHDHMYEKTWRNLTLPRLPNQNRLSVDTTGTRERRGYAIIIPLLLGVSKFSGVDGLGIWTRDQLKCGQDFVSALLKTPQMNQAGRQRYQILSISAWVCKHEERIGPHSNIHKSVGPRLVLVLCQLS